MNNIYRRILKMTKEDDKIVISLQIPNEFYDYLKKKATEECTSVSYLVRKMIIRDINSHKGDEN